MILLRHQRCAMKILYLLLASITLASASLESKEKTSNVKFLEEINKQNRLSWEKRFPTTLEDPTATEYRKVEKLANGDLVNSFLICKETFFENTKNPKDVSVKFYFTSDKEHTPSFEDDSKSSSFKKKRINR